MMLQMRTKTTASLALLTATGLALAAPALAAAPKTYKVGMSAEEYVLKKAKNVKMDANDDPVLTITSGDSIKLVWPEIGDTHDMAYKKGDTVVWQTEGFASSASIIVGPKSTASSILEDGRSLKKVISKPGTYKLYCTFHSGTMRMKLVVKKK